jgi:DsbC/DsbD-like thiol-disulfide interchange protein
MTRRASLTATAAACLLLTSCGDTSVQTASTTELASHESTAGAPQPQISSAAVPVGSRPTAVEPVTAKRALPASEESRLPAAVSPSVAAPESPSLVTATLRSDLRQIRAGEEFTLTLNVEIAEGWHIYAVDRPTGPAVRTAIELPLPAGLESAGNWTLPDPIPDDSTAGEPAFVYHGSIAFQRRLRAARGTPGPISLSGTLRYQACDRDSCRAPAKLKFDTSLQLVP